MIPTIPSFWIKKKNTCLILFIHHSAKYYSYEIGVRFHPKAFDGEMSDDMITHSTWKTRLTDQAHITQMCRKYNYRSLYIRSKCTRYINTHCNRLEAQKVRMTGTVHRYTIHLLM